MKFILFVMLSLVCSAALAVDFNDEMAAEMLRLEGLNSVVSGDGTDPSCTRQYAGLYNKRIIKISFGFGYGDSTPGNLVWDHYTYSAFMNRITQPCEYYNMAMCGFTRDPRDANLLRKVAYAPTDERSFMIELRVTRGSLSGNNANNISRANLTRQMNHCRQAAGKFMTEVARGADIVIYTGHSRNGGGPDFCPPLLTADRQHVNYPEYRRTRTGINALTAAMRRAVTAGTPNKVVGMFSCSSNLHFRNRLGQANPNAGLILTSRNASFEEMVLDSFAALDGLLVQRCRDGFERSFAARERTILVNMFTRR